MKQPNDSAIIELYFARDEGAIAQTDRKYRQFLLSIARNILHDAHDSEECLNDCYLDIWNAIPPERPGNFKAFLATVIRRKAIDRYKAASRKKRVPSELTASISELEDILTDRDSVQSTLEDVNLSRLIDDFVHNLPKRQMYIFISRYYAARPISQIASRLGCSQSTVNKEIASIKRNLKQKLESEGYPI